MYNTLMTNFLADEKTGIELLYRQKSIHDVAFCDEIVDRFNQHSTELEIEPISTASLISKDFNIPQHYKNIDVEEYIRGLIPTSGDSAEAVKARVEMELDMYKTRNLYPIIQLLIYIVDTMRRNNLVWGVGRGSCVSSYVLYILGVHKVDSYKYNLDIKEFLK